MSTDTTNRSATDPAAVEEFTETVVADVKGHQAAWLACLGDHLGLFAALAERPADGATLAARLGLDARQVEEWLAGMRAAGYVSHDDRDGTYRLTGAQAAVLARDDTPVAMGGVFHELVGMWDVFEDIERSFATGEGMALDDYPASWWDGMERFTGAAFETQLVQEWVAKADGVAEALADGARVADVGCGRGRALVTLLEHHEDATGVGFDLSEAQLAGARHLAREAGLEDRVEFRHHDAATGLDGTFDVVTSFDVMHDLVDVDGVFAAVHDALAPDGSWLLVDFDVAPEPADNVGPIATILYGFSVAYCLPTSIAGDGDALGTCGLPPAEVRARAADAGFRDVREIDVEDPFNLLYQLHP